MQYESELTPRRYAPAEYVADKPSFLIDSTGVLHSMSHKTLWSTKLVIVVLMILALGSSMMVSYETHQAVFQVLVLVVFAVQVFYSVAVLWSSTYTDIAVLTALTVWFVYSAVDSSFRMPLGLQLSRDIVAVVLVWILDIRCCVMARLEEIRKYRIQPHWKNFLSMMCYSPGNVSFYVGTDLVLGDAQASPFGVFVFGLAVLTAVFVPVVMLVPCAGNAIGGESVALWMSPVKMFIMGVVYFLCDKLFTPTDRLEQRNAPVILINCIMTLLVHPYIYPMILAQALAMLLAVAKFMPVESGMIVQARDIA